MSKETDAVTEMEQRFELMGILDQLNADERAVVLDVALRSARKVLAGRQKYGPMDLASDPRDWMEEASQEADDLANYYAMARVQRSRRG